MIVAGSIEYERIQGKLSSIEPIMFQEAEYLAKQVFLSFTYFLFESIFRQNSKFEIYWIDIVFIQVKQSCIFNSNFEFSEKPTLRFVLNSAFFLVFFFVNFFKLQGRPNFGAKTHPFAGRRRRVQNRGGTFEEELSQIGRQCEVDVSFFFK